MPAAGAFGMKGVNGSALEGRDCIFDKPALVQRVGVNGNLHIHLIRDREAAIDGGWGSAPVFMKLEPAGAGLDLLNETLGQGRITLAQEAEIHGESISSLEHALDMPRPRRAGRGIGSGCRPCATTHHGGEACIEGFLDLLRADVVDMRVDAASSDNLAFAGDRLGARSDDDVDARLHVGIAGFAYGGDEPLLDADIRLRNATVIENERVGDDRINRAVAAGTLRLTHAVADDFAAAKFHLLAIDREVPLHLDDEIGIGEAHFVADRWAKHLRIGGTVHYVGHFRLPQSIQRKLHVAGTCGNAPMTAWLKP